MNSPAKVPRLELSLCLVEEDEEQSSTHQLGNLKHSDRMQKVQMLGSIKQLSAKTDMGSSYQGSPLSQPSSHRIKPFPTKIKSLTIATDVSETNGETQDAGTQLTHTLFRHDSRIAGRYNQPGGSLRVSFLQTEDGVCSFVQSDLAVNGDHEHNLERDLVASPTPRSPAVEKEVPLLRRSVLGIMKRTLRRLFCGSRVNHRKIAPTKRR